MKPCNCKSMHEAFFKLNEQGISFNNNSLFVEPNIVEMHIDATTIRIPMRIFERFARWYLTDQEESEDK